MHEDTILYGSDIQRRSEPRPKEGVLAKGNALRLYKIAIILVIMNFIGMFSP